MSERVTGAFWRRMAARLGPLIHLIGTADYLTDFGCVAVNKADLVLAAYRLLAALRDDTPAAVDMARFPADGKNKTDFIGVQSLDWREISAGIAISTSALT